MLPSWGDLPVLVLTEVYKHLDEADRLAAASVCKSWRFSVFQPRFFRRIALDVSRENEKKNGFFLRNVAHLVESISIRFDSQSLFSVQQTAKILQKLSASNCLRSIKIAPKHSAVVAPAKYNCPNFIQKFFLEPIRTLVSKRENEFIELDFGGLETLILQSGDLLQSLGKPEKLSVLGMASVKEDPTYYYIMKLDTDLLKQFSRLQKLSIDYDHVDDHLLKTLENVQSLEVLVINVHGVDSDEPGTSERAWSSLVAKELNLRVHLNLIYAYEAVHVLHSHILCSNMPLSHLKVLFCSYINYEALEFLSHFNKTLRSVVWVDMISDDNANDPFMVNTNELYLRNEQPDPLVMLAWMCKNLEELVINGYVIEPNNLIGIARLRGSKLQRLEVSHIVWCPNLGEISHLLGKPWNPLPHTPLNKIFMRDGNPNKELLRDEYVMETLQSDFDGVTKY